MKKIRVAMIGCGAVTEAFHLPAIALAQRIGVTILVDKFLPRARQLADNYNIPAVTADYREIFGKADTAVVALPNHLHAPVTIDLLRHKIHVLVEKPMALRTSECDEMINTADEAGVILAVGLVRRFYYSSQFVKQLLESRLLGDIVRFDLREGAIFSWAAASDYMVRKESAGGGELTGIGSHALDLLLWWLGDYDQVEYYDDAMGGVEADCELHLRLQNGVTGVVELSRTRNLRNTCIIYGERGILEVGTNFNPLVQLKIEEQDVMLTGQVVRDGKVDKTLRDTFRRQLDDFVDAILNHRQPFNPGREGRRAVKLIETCYALRQPLKQPWMFMETLIPGGLT